MTAKINSLETLEDKIEELSSKGNKINRKWDRKNDQLLIEGLGLPNKIPEREIRDNFQDREFNWPSQRHMGGEGRV